MQEEGTGNGRQRELEPSVPTTLPQVRRTWRTISTRGKSLPACELPQLRPSVAVEATSGVQVDELHLAVRIGLLEYLLQVAARRVLRNVQLPRGIGQ